MTNSLSTGWAVAAVCALVQAGAGTGPGYPVILFHETPQLLLGGRKWLADTENPLSLDRCTHVWRV